jgi:2-haloalkanoic acid dehalogenase type II
VVASSFTALGRELGIDVPATEAHRLGASIPDWPAFPDSHDALAALSARYRLIILSNVDHTSFAGTNRRLGVRFDAIVTAQDVGAYKPSLDNFRALLASAADLGIQTGRLLHVAQSLFHDHVPAKTLGLPTVWINRRPPERAGAAGRVEPPVAPDWEFRSMAHFAAAICAEVG